MFVVCPSCAGPFRIPADQIAPLVQIACPHCEFRMILDFEAANDPSLVESGHLMAQGFENIEQYSSVYSHVGPQPDVQPRQVEAPARPVEAVKPIETMRPAEATKVPPTTPAAQPVSQQARPLARPTSEPTPQPTPVSAAQPQPRGSKTIIQTPKKVASIEGMPALEPRPKQPSGPTMRAGRNSEMITEPAVPATEAKVSAVEPETPSRLPPHTPPAATAVSNAPTTPEPATTTRPEDIAAQSGSHPSKPEKAAEPVKVETKEPTRPAADGEKKPPATQPTGGSNTIYIIIVLVVVLAAIAAIYLGTRS